MSKPNSSIWEFIDDEGTFRLRNPHLQSSLYFPLVNEAGIFSAISPTLRGDIKHDHNSFLMPPVSAADLADARSARNFWIQQDGIAPWSVTGNSALQNAGHFTSEDEESILEAGFLWQQVTRKDRQGNLQAVITSFIPASMDQVELMKITIKNLSGGTVRFTATAAIPLYGRSADNLRDHRHVTSLLNRTQCIPHGILVHPTLSFDERGHQPNQLTYVVLGADGNGNKPEGFFPLVDDFIGQGGSLDWPQSIVQRNQPIYHAGMEVDGYEPLGGLQFEEISLLPGEEFSYIVILAIMTKESSDAFLDTYGSTADFNNWLERTKEYWQSTIEALRIFSSTARYDGWMRWVTIQPILRRLFGNSFLPHHDYGRGGRGWRDLWQDILALLMMEKGDISKMLFDNFGGVRFDGSNATIIGSGSGEFKADRNNIPRVWMDHGVWPLLTTSLYIDQTGDIAFLLRNQVYFKDHLSARTMRVDDAWSIEQGTLLRKTDGEPYQGTILEHLLVQNLVPFFNVGEHNNYRLEGADWNDALDMAGARGESVAFSAMYAGNLRRLSEWVIILKNTGVNEVEIASELSILLDTFSSKVDYDSVDAKIAALAVYFDTCAHAISGKKITIPLQDLANDLAAKSDWLGNHLRNQEWLTNADGYGWFNGYYDNNGMRVEGDFPTGVRMTLTGQVFALMGGVANEEQVKEIVRSVDKYLFDPNAGGYRLNTNFGEVLLSLGRGFGFAYGHKENGAMFSHMAVMYANALYQRGFVKEGYKILDGIYEHCQDFSRSHMYPGIPEYIDNRGRGMYAYLTGSASWYLLTLVTESFGVKGIVGDIMLEPKLMAKQFDDRQMARLITNFADRKMEIIYSNASRLDYGDYQIRSAYLDDQPVEFSDESILIPRSRINSLSIDGTHTIKIGLAK